MTRYFEVKGISVEKPAQGEQAYILRLIGDKENIKILITSHQFNEIMRIFGRGLK